jgi:hypothetical protein
LKLGLLAVRYIKIKPERIYSPNKYLGKIVTLKFKIYFDRLEMNHISKLIESKCHKVAVACSRWRNYRGYCKIISSQMKF